MRLEVDIYYPQEGRYTGTAIKIGAYWLAHPRHAGLVLAHEIGHAKYAHHNMGLSPREILHQEITAWGWALARRPYHAHEWHFALRVLQSYVTGFGLSVPNLRAELASAVDRHREGPLSPTSSII